MNLDDYNKVIIVPQEETENMFMSVYRELILKSDLLLADQGMNKYRVMKDRYGNMKNEIIYLKVNEVARLLLKCDI